MPPSRERIGVRGLGVAAGVREADGRRHRVALQVRRRAQLPARGVAVKVPSADGALRVDRAEPRMGAVDRVDRVNDLLQERRRLLSLAHPRRPTQRALPLQRPGERDRGDRALRRGLRLLPLGAGQAAGQGQTPGAAPGADPGPTTPAGRGARLGAARLVASGRTRRRAALGGAALAPLFRLLPGGGRWPGSPSARPGWSAAATAGWPGTAACSAAPSPPGPGSAPTRRSPAGASDRPGTAETRHETVNAALVSVLPAGLVAVTPAGVAAGSGGRVLGRVRTADVGAVEPPLVGEALWRAVEEAAGLIRSPTAPGAAEPLAEGTGMAAADCHPPAPPPRPPSQASRELVGQNERP